MTVTMIDCKLLLFDVKREESIFNYSNIVYLAFSRRLSRDSQCGRVFNIIYYMVRPN